MKPPIEFRPKPGKGRKASTVLPEKAPESGGVQFPLVDRDQVSNTVQVRTSEVQSSAGSQPERSPGSDSPERRAPTQAELDAFLEDFKAKERAKVLARVHRHRAKKSKEGVPE